MSIEQDIEAVRTAIKAGRYSNEASVSQGIVLRMLNSLGWPTYDTDAVWPEYSLSGRRVDYALCSPPGKPIAFIEVKQIGQSDGAERQLFEYAYHEGVPMAILTDGREWNFYLPGEQGSYGDRRVYKLDLLDRELAECVERLERYLKKADIESGAALQAARDDYRNASRVRQMQSTIPKAWTQLIAEEDDLLLELVAERVECLCGFKPDIDMVAAYLKGSLLVATPSSSDRPTTTTANPAAPLPIATPPTAGTEQGAHHTTSNSLGANSSGYVLQGTFHPARNAIETLRLVFEQLIANDGTFASRFAALPKHGRSRRYLALDPRDLYAGREDLAREYSQRLSNGWWMSTNHSKATIARIIEMACNVAGIQYGSDLTTRLG